VRHPFTHIADVHATRAVSKDLDDGVANLAGSSTGHEQILDGGTA